MASKLIDDEPVLVATAAGAVVNSALTILATHHIITTAQVSADTKTFAPIVAFVITALIGLVARKLVTPAKKVEDLLAKAGLLSDVDLGAIDALIAKYSGSDTTPAPVADDAAPDSATAGAPVQPAPAA